MHGSYGHNYVWKFKDQFWLEVWGIMEIIIIPAESGSLGPTLFMNNAVKFYALARIY